ncbi:MAG: hypothetical protein ACFNTU_00430, partial [Catonella sp.]
VDIDLSIADPMLALADQFARMDEDPLLYDPDIIKRPKYVLDLVKENEGIKMKKVRFTISDFMNEIIKSDSEYFKLQI